MAKFLIKKTETPNGTISFRHEGKDTQYCEAGKVVEIDWMPTAGWGLQEAHYTDGNGNVVAIDLKTRKFTMPASHIEIGGTFKRFVVQDWTEGKEPSVGDVLVVGDNGEPTPKPMEEVAGEVLETEALTEALDGKVDEPAEAGESGQVLQLDAEGKPRWVTPSAGTVPDTEMSDDSTNAVQNKVIKKYVDDEAAKKANVDGSYETLYAGSAGSIRGTKTNTDTYLERPTGGEGNEVANGLASMVALKGNSVVVNQLLRLSGTKTSQGITFTDNGDGSLTINGTAPDVVFPTYEPIIPNLINGHKYYQKPSKENKYYSRIKNATRNVNYTYSIFTFKGESTDIVQSLFTIQPNSGTYDNERVFVQLFDLTLLGIDNLNTTAEVEAWLAENVGLKPYYAYNAGSIVNAVMTGIKTTGRNLLDPVTKKARCLYYTWEDHNGMFTVKGLPSGATLTFTPDATGVAEAVTPDADGHFSITGDGWLEASAATAETYVCMTWDETKDDESVAYDANSYPFDVRKVYGQLNGEGEFVQVFGTGMKVDDVLGSTRDAIYVENNITKAVVKIGTVSSLEALSWTKQSNVNVFTAAVLGMNTTDVSSQRIKGLICSRYTLERVNPTYNDMGDKRMIRRSGNVCIKDNNYSDATTFKNSLENVPLNYELATPLTYTNLVYRDNGTDTPLGEVLLNMVVNNWGIEQVEVTPYSDGIPTSCAPTIETLYGIDVVEQLDTIDKEGIDVDALRANLNALVSCINTNCGEVLGGTISVSETATDKVFAFTFTPNEEPTNNTEE